MLNIFCIIQLLVKQKKKMEKEWKYNFNSFIPKIVIYIIYKLGKLS